MPKRSSDIGACCRIIEAVIHLHDWGFGNLRVSTGLSPSGAHLRVWVLPSTLVSEYDGITPLWCRQSTAEAEVEMCLAHTTGNADQPFGWSEAAAMDADELAGLMAARAPELINTAAGEDHEYREWLWTLLAAAYRSVFPIAFGDYIADPLAELAIAGPGEGEMRGKALPLPPPGAGTIRATTWYDRINALRKELSATDRSIADHVWLHRRDYIRWPTDDILLWPGCQRMRFHKYPESLTAKLKSKDIRPDTRSNGPAIAAYLCAGGERPVKPIGHGWSIHHIYDGQFPIEAGQSVPRAVEDESLFTRTGGLVAIHPCADGIASNYPYFSWLLRAEAYRRFRFDPCQFFRH